MRLGLILACTHVLFLPPWLHKDIGWQATWPTTAHFKLLVRFYFVTIFTAVGLILRMCGFCFSGMTWHSHLKISMHNSKRTRFYTYTMTPTLSDSLKRHMVFWYAEEGLIYREIHDRTDCSTKLISKVMGSYQTHGLVTNPFSKQTGRPSKINGGDVEYISSLTARCHAVAHFILLTTLTQITNKEPSFTIKYLDDP